MGGFRYKQWYYYSYSNGFSNPLYETNGVQEHQESIDEDIDAETLQEPHERS